MNTTDTSTPSTPTPAELVAQERAKRKPSQLAPKVATRGKVVRKTTTGKTVELTKDTPKAKAAKVAKPKAEKKPRPQQVGGETVLRNGKLSARDLPCLCGCNEPTQTRDARFRSGHDAKLRQGLIEEGLKADALPAIILPFFKRGEDIAGLRLSKSGKTLTDLKAEGSEEE